MVCPNRKPFGAELGRECGVPSCIVRKLVATNSMVLTHRTSGSASIARPLFIEPRSNRGGAADSEKIRGGVGSRWVKNSSDDPALNLVLTSIGRTRISALLAISAHFRAELPEAPHDSTALR